jgi:hypothetical protein
MEQQLVFHWMDFDETLIFELSAKICPENSSFITI